MVRYKDDDSAIKKAATAALVVTGVAVGGAVLAPIAVAGATAVATGISTALSNVGLTTLAGIFGAGAAAKV